MCVERQRHGCFRLPGAEVQVVEVVRDRLVERWQLGVDQEMVMAGIGLLDAGRLHWHVGGRADGRLRAQHRPVLQADEVHPGIGGRGLAGRGVDHPDLDARRYDRGVCGT